MASSILKVGKARLRSESPNDPRRTVWHVNRNKRGAKLSEYDVCISFMCSFVPFIPTSLNRVPCSSADVAAALFEFYKLSIAIGMILRIS